MTDNPIRIAIYHATLPGDRGKKGGVEASVHRIANGLADHVGCEVTVFSSSPAPKDARYRHRRVLERTNKHRVTRLFLSPFLLNFIDFSEFDVIHYHGDDWFHFHRGRPTVRTFHGSALGEARSATSLKRRLSMRLVYLLEKLSAQLATAKIAVNTETAALYNAEHVLGNGVDTAVFTPRPKTPHPSISFVGTWDGRKRGQFLFQVFIEEILKQIPDCRLTMISDRSDSHAAVTQLTEASDQDVAHIIGESWLFAYPSTYEGFGIPYIEAMAAGTAIVTTPNGGAREVLSDGEFGVFSDDGSFGCKVVELLRDTAAREKLQKRGCDRATVFSSEAIAAGHYALYKSLLKIC